MTRVRASASPARRHARETPPMALAGADKTAMPEDDSSTLHAPEIPDKRRSWLDRISSMLSGEPSTRDDLVELLRDVQADGLIAADTLKMMEGALTVSELSVGDVMVPRSQMVMLAADEKLIDIGRASCRERVCQYV